VGSAAGPMLSRVHSSFLENIPDELCYAQNSGSPSATVAFRVSGAATPSSKTYCSLQEHFTGAGAVGLRRGAVRACPGQAPTPLHRRRPLFPWPKIGSAKHVLCSALLSILFLSWGQRRWKPRRSAGLRRDEARAARMTSGVGQRGFGQAA
jgi:hypothetical protein